MVVDSPDGSIDAYEQLINVPTLSSTQKRDDKKTRKRKLIVLFAIVFCLSSIAVGFAVHWFSRDVDSPVGEIEQFEEIGEYLERPQVNKTKCKRRIVAFFNNSDVSKYELSLLTHAVFDGMVIKENGFLEFKTPAMEKKFYEWKSKASSLDQPIKLMVSIDGKHLFEVLKVFHTTQQNFVKSTIAFVEKNELYGINMASELPRTPKEMENYLEAFGEIRYRPITFSQRGISERCHVSVITNEYNPEIFSKNVMFANFIHPPGTNYHWIQPAIDNKTLKYINLPFNETDPYQIHRYGAGGIWLPAGKNGLLELMDIDYFCRRTALPKEWE